VNGSPLPARRDGEGGALAKSPSVGPSVLLVAREPFTERAMRPASVNLSERPTI